MKVLLLFPSNYSIKGRLKSGFEKNGFLVKSLNYTDIVNRIEAKIDSKTSNFHNGFIKKKWSKYYTEKINEGYIQTFKAEKPDIVFIYNNQYVLPETIRWFKKHNASVCVFLGDNPLYSSTFDLNLTMLFDVDIIISPDTYWVEQLNNIGLKNVYFDLMGFSNEENEITQLNDNEAKYYNNDIVFIGSSYLNAWGFRRALFYSQFAGMNMKIYGDANWLKWLEFFPQLKPHFNYKKKHFDFSTVNEIMNTSKIYPVDANPGIINGMHVRIIDCLAANVLPLIEYRKDIEIVFTNIEFPVIRNFSEARLLAEYYIKNDEIRIELIKKLREELLLNYTPSLFVKRLLKNISFGS